MVLTQLFRLTGVANSVVYDGGLKSTEVEKKRLISVNLVTTGMADNDIQGWHERAKVFDIPDRLIDYQTAAAPETYASPGARINEIEVGLDIPVGEVFKVAINCGATLKSLHGFYKYELIK